MALMHPRTFPHDLTRKPKARGEFDVYNALSAALDDDWAVIYDRSIAGSRRRIDFLIVNPQRGLLAFEVKGGQVHDKRGAFRQVVSQSGMRKKIDPFGQLNLGLRDLFAAARVSPLDMPVHKAIWFPGMSQAGLRWRESPHIWTRECLAPLWIGTFIGSLQHRVPDTQNYYLEKIRNLFVD